MKNIKLLWILIIISLMMNVCCVFDTFLSLNSFTSVMNILHTTIETQTSILETQGTIIERQNNALETQDLMLKTDSLIIKILGKYYYE